MTPGIPLLVCKNKIAHAGLKCSRADDDKRVGTSTGGVWIKNAVTAWAIVTWDPDVNGNGNYHLCISTHFLCSSLSYHLCKYEYSGETLFAFSLTNARGWTRSQFSIQPENTL